MAKKTSSEEEELTFETPASEEFTEEEQTNSTENTEKNTEDFEDAFAEFERTSSEHNFEKDKNDDDDESELDIVDQFKVKMFLGLVFTLLDGFHAFIYQMVTKYKISKEDIGLSDDDKEAVSWYFQSKKLIALINKIPKELIGLIQIEYIYYCNFQDLKNNNELELKDKHKITKKVKEIIEREEEEEEEEEEEVEQEEEVEEEPEELTDAEFEAQAKADAEKNKSEKKVTKQPAKKRATKKAKKK